MDTFTFGDGGGFYIDHTSSIVSIKSSYFRNTSAYTSGGFAFMTSGSIFSVESSSIAGAWSKGG